MKRTPYKVLAELVQELSDENDLLHGEVGNLHERLGERDKELAGLRDRIVGLAEALRKARKMLRM